MRRVRLANARQPGLQKRGCRSLRRRACTARGSAAAAFRAWPPARRERAAAAAAGAAHRRIGGSKAAHLRVCCVLERVEDLFQRHGFARAPVHGLPHDAICLRTRQPRSLSAARGREGWTVARPVAARRRRRVAHRRAPPSPASAARHTCAARACLSPRRPSLRNASVAGPVRGAAGAAGGAARRALEHWPRRARGAHGRRRDENGPRSGDTVGCRKHERSKPTSARARSSPLGLAAQRGRTIPTAASVCRRLAAWIHIKPKAHGARHKGALRTACGAACPHEPACSGFLMTCATGAVACGTPYGAAGAVQQPHGSKQARQW